MRPLIWDLICWKDWWSFLLFALWWGTITSFRTTFPLWTSTIAPVIRAASVAHPRSWLCFRLVIDFKMLVEDMRRFWCSSASPKLVAFSFSMFVPFKWLIVNGILSPWWSVINGILSRWSFVMPSACAFWVLYHQPLHGHLGLQKCSCEWHADIMCR